MVLHQVRAPHPSTKTSASKMKTDKTQVWAIHFQNFNDEKGFANTTSGNLGAKICFTF
jgi:hypothetical protein